MRKQGKKRAIENLLQSGVQSAALSDMRRAYEAGHAIAAFDALVYSKERNLQIPGWAARAITLRDYATRTRKGQRPAHMQYLQYLKQAVRYLAVRCCESERYERRQDKFERAFEVLEGHWAATKDSSGLKISFYKYKKRAHEFYLSYIFYRLSPVEVGFLYQTINQKRKILFDLTQK